MVEMDVKPSWVGQSLVDLDLRGKYSLNIIAIRQQGDVSIDIDPHRALEADMKLLVVANTAKLNKIK
jgi:trk system potassium uptake protein TrkA